MRAALPLAIWSAAALAGGEPPVETSRKILQDAESHAHELRRLHAADALLEIQLRIAQKLQECQRTGFPCLGAGSAPEPIQARAESPTSTPAPAMNPPRLIGVYQGRAQLRLDGGQRVEVRAGQRLGPWRIGSVEVDSLELLDAGGARLRLPVTRSAP